MCFKHVPVNFEKMFPSSTIHCFIFMLVISLTKQIQHFLSDEYSVNSINCPNDKKCTHIEHCAPISKLLNENRLPIHRLRQAICSYESTRIKVCCEVGSNTINPLFMREDGSPPWRTNNFSPECGKSFIDEDINAMGMYPFVARIGFKSNFGNVKYPCSGAILNDRTILTTANCALAESSNYKLDSILVGDFDDDSDYNVQKVNISYVMKHPNYRAETFMANIAMLRLKEPMRYTETVQPVCLVLEQRYENEDVNSILVGWGKLEDQKLRSCKQQALRMKIVSKQRCTSYSAKGLSVELCATGDKMPCSGYNGSPLLHKSGETYSLLGILSYGSECSIGSNFPSVFVNVQKYVRWILENC